MLTHEMIHLAFPSMADEHHWIEEGLSVYVEPIGAFVPAIGRRSKCGATSSAICRRDFRERTTREWTTHTLGEEHTGAVRSLFCCEWKFGSKRKTKKDWKMRCAGFSTQAATLMKIGNWRRRLKTATEQWDWMCWEIVRGVERQAGASGSRRDVEKVGCRGQRRKVASKDDAPLSAVRHAIETGTPARKQATSRRHPVPERRIKALQSRAGRWRFCRRTKIELTICCGTLPPPCFLKDVISWDLVSGSLRKM